MNEIKKYTAEDFARYHAGTMPAGEMHTLEKAALEDPFLEDALEGYSITPTASSDAAHLRERISEVVSAKKVFFLSPKRGWWRIAALLVIMAGAGYLFLKVNNSVSKQNNLAKNEKAVQVDAGFDSAAGTFTLQDTAAAGKIHSGGNTSAATTVTSSAVTIPSQGAATWSNSQTAPVTNVSQQQADFSAPVAAAPLNATATNESADLAQNTPQNYYLNTQSNKAVNGISRNNNALSNNAGYNNIYNKDLNGISTAPVANAADRKANVGTVADDQEKFKINIADSIVFASNTLADKSITTALKKAAPGIAAQKARADSDAAVVTALGIRREPKNLNAATTRTTAEIISIPAKKGADKNSEVELSGRTSLPSSGQTAVEKAAFDKYIKENMQPVYNQAGGRMAGEILLSFTVKKGRPKNIKVAMSLCPPCEAQAIQLLESGPDWQGKKNEEKTVIIKF